MPGLEVCDDKDLCNGDNGVSMAGRPHFSVLLLIATVLILAADVVRNIR